MRHIASLRIAQHCTLEKVCVVGLRLLKELTQTFSKEELKRRVEGNLCKIGDGERDLYF